MELAIQRITAHTGMRLASHVAQECRIRRCRRAVPGLGDSQILIEYGNLRNKVACSDPAQSLLQMPPCLISCVHREWSAFERSALGRDMETSPRCEASSGPRAGEKENRRRCPAVHRSPTRGS